MKDLSEKKRLVISINSSWNVYNFREGLVKSLNSSGYQVTVLTPEDAFSSKIEMFGCKFCKITMKNGRISPVHDIILTAKYFIKLKSIDPYAYLGFTIKPNIYGTIAARLLGINTINNVAGLGSMFSKDGFLQKIALLMYKVAVNKSNVVFFQNIEDLKLFVDKKVVKTQNAKLLPGSGVDLEKFSPYPLPSLNKNNQVTFLFFARILKEKGIYELVEATKLLLNKGYKFKCVVLGFLDVDNPSSVNSDTFNRWMREGLIQYKGASEDVRGVIRDADCVVLPTYYPEGTPRSLLEAAAMARPIITTNSPGCRDVIEDKKSGYFCKPKDASDLSKKMELIINLEGEKLEEMGLLGRKRIEENFDEKIVVKEYLDVIDSFIKC